MKRLLVNLCLFVIPFVAYSQNYNSEKAAWIKYIVRMYNASPFEGVKIVEDSERTFLISVLSLDISKYGNNPSTYFRVATVKAQSQANTFFNISKITSETIVRTSGLENDSISNDVIEEIRMNSTGYVQGLELVDTFDSDSGRKVFIYSTEIIASH